METFYLREGEEFIRLGQVLKATGLVDTGAEAKDVILQGEVTVNSETEIRRGRKLYKGDIFSYGGKEIRIGE